MKLRTILAGTAIASLALVSDAGAPLGFPFAPQAEAAVNISLSVFYDDLAQHGDWVRYREAYVFIPADVDRDWRPYTLGHWVYTDRYGWTWVSEEPFGWATYHYGRWGYAEDIGWYWVPGTRWAPAWVSWRRSNDYIVWAPLPPSGGGVEVSVSVTVGDIPDFYWVAVPAREFLAPDIHVVVVREETEIRRVIERTEFAGTPQVTNNIVVNNVIDVNVVQQVTGQEVKTVEVKETDDPRQAKATEQQVTVFQGEIAQDAEAKPKKVREAAEVKKVKRGGKQGEAAGTQPVPEPDATGTTTGTATGTDAPAAKTPPAGTAAEQPPAQVEQPAGQAQGEDQQQPPAGQAEGETKQQKPPASKAEGTADEPADDATGTTEPVGEPKATEGKATGKEKAKGDKKAKPDCDPAADPDCQPAQ